MITIPSTVKLTPQFKQWLKSLKCGTTRIRLARRIDKAQRGIMGDIKPVGMGVTEMREHFGPGWRMYYTQKNQSLIIMLGGGDKSKQHLDINQAIKLAQTLKE